MFIPFGAYQPDEVVKPSKNFVPSGVDLINAETDRVDADANKASGTR